MQIWHTGILYHTGYLYVFTIISMALTRMACVWANKLYNNHTFTAIGTNILQKFINLQKLMAVKSEFFTTVIENIFMVLQL